MRSAGGSPTLIKRYAGRRLYHTERLIYLTFDDLAQMVVNGERFVVRDAESGGDITRSILDRLQ